MPKAPSQQPGKGKHWAAAAPSQANNGRKLVHEGRILGTVHEWNNTWGWIVPLQKITHPMFRGNKLYCHRKDVSVPGGALTPGSTVDFLLYADGRGLGAGDVREADAGAASTGVAANEAEALPEGWTKVWSEENSEYYYWNKATHESSWVPPEMPEAAEEEEDDTLPEGWTRNFDPENNEYYYWHAPSKTTTWERPRREAAKEPTPAQGEEEPAPEAPEPEAPAAADGPVLGQQRVKGIVEKWEGFFGWIAPQEDLGEDLRPLLENRQDRIYCNWRDVSEGTTIQVGSLVDYLLYADSNGLGASDVRLQKDEQDEAPKPAPAPARGKKQKRQAQPRDAMAELERQWAEQDAKLGLDAGDTAEANAAAEPTHGVADAQEMEDAPLLPGWEQHWSEEHSCFYYWHKVAKQASWERPCIPGVSSDRKEDKIWEGEGAEEGAAKLATPITPVQSWAGKEITPLTPATAADKEEARRATGAPKQPSAGFRMAQASGMFQGRGWRGEPHEAAKPQSKPALSKRPGQGPQKGGAGKGGNWTAGAAANKRLRAQ